MRVRSTDAGRHCLGRGGVIGHTKMQAFIAFGCTCNFVDILHAKGGFNDQFEPDAFFAALGGLDLGCHHIKRIDIGGRSDLGDHDQVKPVTGLFEHIDDIAIHIMCIKAVDADRKHLVAPVDIVDGGNDVFARLFLVVWRNRVLKVKEDGIGL